MNDQDTNTAAAQARAGKQANATGPNKSNSTDTVTVGCKLPHGLMLTLTEHGKPARSHRVKGSNASGVIGGFGITPGVPRDFWEEWFKHHASLDFVKKEFVFAYGDTASARDKAKDGAAIVNGLEAIDPTKALPKEIKTLEKDPV